MRSGPDRFLYRAHVFKQGLLLLRPHQERWATGFVANWFPEHTSLLNPLPVVVKFAEIVQVRNFALTFQLTNLCTSPKTRLEILHNVRAGPWISKPFPDHFAFEAECPADETGFREVLCEEISFYVAMEYSLVSPRNLLLFLVVEELEWILRLWCGMRESNSRPLPGKQSFCN